MSDRDKVIKTFDYFKSVGEKISKKDISLYLECQKKRDYAPIHLTKLYNKKGVLYCRMLEVLNALEEGKPLYYKNFKF